MNKHASTRNSKCLSARISFRRVQFQLPLLFMSSLLLFSGIAMADWRPEDGHKMHFPQLPDEEGWDVNATAPMILADDWQCSETGTVTDIHFWGSWRDIDGDGVGDVGQVQSFIISIHDDIPAGTGGIPYSRPGNTLREWEISDFVVPPIDPPLLEGWYDPASGVLIPNDHGEYFQYNITGLDQVVPDPFVQEQGRVYWLNISAILAPNPLPVEWGWKSSRDHFNDDAVWAMWGNLNWIDIYEPPRYNEFDIAIDQNGFMVGSGGTNFYGEGWYEYPSGWINIWFYDNPLSFDNFKRIDWNAQLIPLVDGQVSNATIAINYSTDTWSEVGNPPTEPRRPPLPGDDETAYIIREIIWQGEIPASGLDLGDVLEILDYNPEWISIDVMGVNFALFGSVWHECVQTSLDLAFVINGVCGCNPDINGDGLLSSVDLATLMGCMFLPPTGLCTKADVNCDGLIDIKDFIAFHCMWFGGSPDYCCGQQVGACCLSGTNECRQMTPTDCNNQGGSYFGDGSACGDGQSLSPQACCLTAGTCTMADATCCLNFAGTPQGPNSTCTPVEACCFSDFSCSDLDPLCCIDQGGTPQGPGTDCLIAGICGSPLCPIPAGPFPWCGALQNRDCQTTDPTNESCLPGIILVDPANGQIIVERCDCFSMDPDCGPIDIRPDPGIPGDFVVSCPGPCPPGLLCEIHFDNVPQGFNSINASQIPPGILVTCACASAACEQSPFPSCGGDCPPGEACVASAISAICICQTIPAEACCLIDGTCINANPLVCAAQGGTPQGPGTACSSSEACCLQDGSCEDLDPLCCIAKGGVAQGFGTACSIIQVACCFPDGSCQQVDPECCDDLGGTPSPSGSEACLGDGNGNNIDDACEIGQPPQACCLVTGACVDVGLTRCVELGGDPLGQGTTCDLSPLQCKPLKWAQPPTYGPFADNPNEQCFWGWDEQSRFGGIQLVADDWMCQGGQPVTDIHWWGSYVGWFEPGPLPVPEGPEMFHIAIWTDVPRDSAAQQPFSHPGKLVHEWYVARDALNERAVGCDYYVNEPGPDTCFRYDFILPESEWFYQDPAQNKIYWISIGAIYPDGCACDGDVDGSGALDMGDLVTINECLAGTAPPEQCVKADINCDGTVDTGDVSAWQCLSASLPPDQCCENYMPPPAYPWGWKTREHSFNDDAIKMFFPTSPGIGDTYGSGIPISSADGLGWDMGFVLTSRHPAPSKWNQWPNSDLPGLHAHSGITLADQWECQGGDVTDIHWWGNYEMDGTGTELRGAGIQGYRLSIHSSDPALPWCLPQDPEVWGVSIPYDPLHELPTGMTNSEGSEIYYYGFSMYPGFQQVAGRVYWLDIEALANEPSDPPLWRWQESARGQFPRICPAAERPPGGSWASIVWSTDPTTYTDLAFQITSGPQPVPPDPELGGYDKNRYISMIPGNPGKRTALRVRLTSLQHPIPPNVPDSPPPDFSLFEGEHRWIGPPRMCEDSPSWGTQFAAAELQCEPYYMDWSELWTLAPALHITGAEIVPSSRYDVQTIAEGYDTAIEANYSLELVVFTARWGDIGVPIQDPTDPVRSQPNVFDIVEAVDKVKDMYWALTKRRVQLQRNAPNPDSTCNVTEIVLTVDAVKAKAYDFDGPCPCPSTVVCGVLSCSTSSDCGAGTCVGGFCRDACRRCQP